MQWAVCTAPVCTPHKVTNHPYTNMESIKRAYLGLLKLEEEEKDEEEVLRQQLFSLLPREEDSTDTGFSQSIRGDCNLVHTIIFMASFSWPCCSAYARKSVQEPRASGEFPCMCP